MSARPVLYRRRLIPNECILLEKDVILLQEPSLIVTKWHTLHPKKDLDHGMSCYLLDRGWKISRFLDREGRLICWYCDIIDYTYDASTDTFTFIDLLADVLIYPSGLIKVVDLDEIADATEQGLLSPEQMCSCMRKLDSLLREIYSNRLLPSLAPYWDLK